MTVETAKKYIENEIERISHEAVLDDMKALIWKESRIKALEIAKAALNNAEELYQHGADDQLYAMEDCEGCAFYGVEDWEMPCAKCKRNCKDYFRRAIQNEKR